MRMKYRSLGMSYWIAEHHKRELLARAQFDAIMQARSDMHRDFVLSLPRRDTSPQPPEEE